MQQGAEVGPVPLIYTVCPDRTLTETGQASLSSHIDAATTGCGNTISGPAPLCKYNGPAVACDGSAWDASAEITNLGSEALLSAEFALTMNGDVELWQWSGYLDPGATETVDFGSYTTSGNLSVAMIEVNGQDWWASEDVTIVGSQESSTSVQVRVTTDNYPHETGWAILDNLGNELAAVPIGSLAGQPYTEFIWDVDLEPAGCYTFVMLDEWGDGLVTSVWPGYEDFEDGTAGLFSMLGYVQIGTLWEYDGSSGEQFSSFVLGLNAMPPVLGCVDEEACNYDSEATIDDGSCEYPALYVDCNGICLNDADGDGVCNELEILGCGIPAACNFDPSATDLDITLCVYPGDACDDQDAGTTGDTFDSNCTCIGQGPQPGCLNPVACNFDMNADYSDGSCLFPGDPCDDGNASTSNDTFSDSCGCEGESNVVGCINPNACNYNPDATESDGSCLFPGDPCDDGDAATLNEMYDDSCGCHEDEVSKLTEDILDVALYPNPVRDWLNVRLEDGVAASLVLFDPTGRTVHTWSTVGPTRLDLRHLPPGQYVMSIRPAFGPIRSERIALLAWD